MCKLFLLIILLTGMNSCNKKEYQPQNCDLIFQISEATDFSKAITDATAQNDELKFDHVAMIFIEDGETNVIEASAKHGVTIIPYHAFLKSLPAGYVIKRVKTNNYSPTEVVQHAKSHLGEPYDWSYLPNNGKMYCSELIYECFVNNQGQRLFHAQPMNFRNDKGEIPQFWIELFQKLGEVIPEGVMGTNPNDLSKENNLEEVFREVLSNP